MKIRHWFALSVCVLSTGVSNAQNYPAKPVTLVVGFALDGAIDALVRSVAQSLSATWGHPAVVESRPGASGIIANEYVARAAPDGHTLLISTQSLTLNALLYGKLPYDTMKDLTPIAGLIRTYGGIAVRPTLAVNNLRDLIELARAKPGQLTYATFGIGTAPHLIMERIQSAEKISLNHVPYKGMGQALIDVSAGRVDMTQLNVNNMLPLSTAGKLKAIAVTTSQRSRLMPDLPTVAESGGGLAGFDAAGWWGFHAPSGVPRSIVEKVNADLQKILSDPSFRTKAMDPQGYEPIVMTVPQFDTFVKADMAEWAKIIREIKIRLD
jgi:tripartite-type tricarboxylate transporter receptor subunit TctC